MADWDHDAQVMGITALRTLFSLGFVLGTGITSGLAKLDMRSVFLVIAGVALALSMGDAYLLRRIEHSYRAGSNPCEKSAGNSSDP